MDNVEVDELFDYIDYITENEEKKENFLFVTKLTQEMNALSSLYHSSVTKLTQENQQLKNDICNLKSQFKPSAQTETNSNIVKQAESNNLPQIPVFTPLSIYVNQPTATPKTGSGDKSQIPTSSPSYLPPKTDNNSKPLFSSFPIQNPYVQPKTESGDKSQIATSTPFYPSTFQPIAAPYYPPVCQNSNTFSPKGDHVFDGIINFLKKNNVKPEIKVKLHHHLI